MNRLSVATETVQLPLAADIGSVERSLEKSFTTLGIVPEDLNLNLSDCGYIDVPALVYLIAFISQRRGKGFRTTIQLPKSKNVRDFLRLWDFPKAFNKATGCPFFEVVAESDRVYFGENVNAADIGYAIFSPDGSVQRLLSQRFFSLLSFIVDRASSTTRVVLDETKRWESRLVQSVINKHLRGPEGYVASRIIFEAMTNAFRHSRARIVQTASHFDSKTSSWTARQEQGLFTIVFWDDGESMIDTLRSAISDGLAIRAMDIPELYSDYRIFPTDSAGHAGPDLVVRSDLVPTAQTSDEILFLSTTFPGITRDVQGKGHVVHEALHRADKRLASPGMGLYVLVNTVVDLFGGSVSFRSGELFMNIKKTKKSLKDPNAPDHQVKIKHLNPSLPKFLGNMVTIRIPIGDAKP